MAFSSWHSFRKIQEEGRGQRTLFPVTPDELICLGHICPAIDAFVGRLDMVGLGFERAEVTETASRGMIPRELS